MIRIESQTLEEAYADAASALKCSVTELASEIVQLPSSGFMGFFKKKAIIVATIDQNKVSSSKQKEVEPKAEVKAKPKVELKPKVETKPKIEPKPKIKPKAPQKILNDTIMPESFVSMQDDEDEYGDEDSTSYLADYDDEFDNQDMSEAVSIQDRAKLIQVEVNKLFGFICFDIDNIVVSVYNATTLLIEFKGRDAALLIGKEGYRYKALSYMMFNWINTKYQLQLRLEIAEFLKNQEESVSRYLNGVRENVEKDGRAQTKVLDGVLVQIALTELRNSYPDKYVAIRSTNDGLKYIIVNEYRSH